jgi:hypothetical protein
MSNQPVIRKISYPQFVLQAAWEGRAARPMMISLCVIDALAERMEREVDQVSKARAHERLANMRAIGRSAGMDS